VIGETYDVDVVPAVEVRADDPSQASGYVGNHRPDTVVLAVHGGTVAMNRFAVEQAAVDVLAHPMRGDGDFNHVLAKEAAANGVRVEFCPRRPSISPVAGASVASSLRKLRELVDYYDVPYVVSADPGSHLQLRAPRELAAVGEAIGFTAEQIETGLAEWGSHRCTQPGTALGYLRRTRRPPRRRVGSVLTRRRPLMNVTYIIPR